jgi:Protein of unknown function (DUF3761)
MKKSELVGLIATPLMMFALSLPAWADSTPTICKDGTTSTSTGKGTCSGHGGVQKAGTSAASAAPAAAAPAAAPAAPATPAASGATSTCKDGTTSTSTGKGTCSGHGGVQKAGTSAASAAPAAAAPAAAAATPAPAKSSAAAKSAPTAPASNTDPTGATAKCKDGTYSKSQHRSGTCSSHGGVAQWLTAE